SIIWPGPRRRLDNLMIRGRQAGILLLGAIVMFFIASVIEGVMRQTVQNILIRYSFAAATAFAWLLYLLFSGGRNRYETE
ncbi:MAG: hypothetical protein ACKVS6_00245, partial [Planctomycetota bacterium]